MRIDIKRIATGFVGEYCYTHARAAFDKSGFGIITTQPLRLSGSDIFYGMYMLKSFDGGDSWTDPEPCANLVRKPLGGGYEMGICDATPFYHKATDKIILIGYKNTYFNDGPAPSGTKNATAYSVYDRETGDFGELCEIELPEDLGDDFYFCANGCGQCFECDNGDILIPVTHYPLKIEGKPEGTMLASSSVLRCSFDGEKISFISVGEPARLNLGRGVYEPSVIKHGGRYYMCLRNDFDGYITRGDDGQSFEPIRPLCFDDGESVGNYNTQQHFISSDNALYIVYTRRGAGNDHVFRHRAPLFIARVDTDRLCVIRSTEQIAVPERGARLGNFGAVSIDEHHGFVIASEWMQTTPPDHSNYKRCMEYGSDNSIFVSRINFDD